MWRIAFFGRLEERKGIKLFVEAINKLQDDYTVTDMPKFEIYIVGPDAVVDMVRQSDLKALLPEVEEAIRSKWREPKFTIIC